MVFPAVLTGWGSRPTSERPSSQGLKKNFSLVIIALVLIPGIPSVVEFIRIQLARRKAKSASLEG